MVIDSSAIIAILLGEPEADALMRAMAYAATNQRYIAAPTLLETRLVIYRKLGQEGLELLEKLLYRFGVSIESFTEEHTAYAQEAFINYSKAPAKLNFGDCFSYALAKNRKDELLYKGNDFKHTDVTPVSY